MTARYALLFPGQGAQAVGMGKDLAEGFPEARRLFEQANSVLGYSISRLCWEGPQEALTRTEHCQPALFVTSMAVLAALEAVLGKPTIPAATAGLSLGEYTALAAAGAFSFEDGLRLVRLRGQAMEEASRMSPGTMASVLGLELPLLEEICKQTGAEVANINCPGQLVISGAPEAVQTAAERSKEKGAKRVALLEVGGAFHSRLMQPAATRLKEGLDKIQIHPPRCKVLSNVTGGFYAGSDQIRTLLVEQLTHPVRWEGCVRTLTGSGVNLFLEVGSGTVLKGLLKRIDPQARVVSAGTAPQVREAAAQLA